MVDNAGAADAVGLPTAQKEAVPRPADVESALPLRPPLRVAREK